MSWTEDLKFSVLHTGHGRNACGLQSLLLTIVLVSVECTLDDTLQCSWKKISPKEKVWSTGFCTSLFLNHDCKVSQLTDEKIMQQTNQKSYFAKSERASSFNTTFNIKHQ